jgi:hypothetical protein
MGVAPSGGRVHRTVTIRPKATPRIRPWEGTRCRDEFDLPALIARSTCTTPVTTPDRERRPGPRKMHGAQVPNARLASSAKRKDVPRIYPLMHNEWTNPGFGESNTYLRPLQLGVWCAVTRG